MEIIFKDFNLQVICDGKFTKITDTYIPYCYVEAIMVDYEQRIICVDYTDYNKIIMYHDYTFYYFDDVELKCIKLFKLMRVKKIEFYPKLGYFIYIDDFKTHIASVYENKLYKKRTLDCVTHISHISKNHALVIDILYDLNTPTQRRVSSNAPIYGIVDNIMVCHRYRYDVYIFDQDLNMDLDVYFMGKFNGVDVYGSRSLALLDGHLIYNDHKEIKSYDFNEIINPSHADTIMPLTNKYIMKLRQLLSTNLIHVLNNIIISYLKK